MILFKSLWIHLRIFYVKDHHSITDDVSMSHLWKCSKWLVHMIHVSPIFSTLELKLILKAKIGDISSQDVSSETDPWPTIILCSTNLQLWFQYQQQQQQQQQQPPPEKKKPKKRFKPYKGVLSSDSLAKITESLEKTEMEMFLREQPPQPIPSPEPGLNAMPTSCQSLIKVGLHL